MRNLILIAAVLSSSAALADPGRPPYPDYTGPVRYPAGTSAAAIADNEAVRISIRGTKGLEYCAFIDTRDPRGRCLTNSVLDAGSDGAGGGSAGAGAGGSH